MKQYLMILLFTLGLGGLITSQVNTVAADIMPSTNETISEEYTSLESMLLPEIASIKESEFTDLEDTPEMTYHYNPTHVSNSVAYTTSGTPNFTISVRDDSQIHKSLSYSAIYRFRNLVYAHNSGNLFGVLSSYVPGTIFSITENGVTTTYRVAEVRVFQKINDTTLQLCYQNDYSDCHGTNQLSYIAKSSSYINESHVLSDHSLALMTCTGAAYGNGDASHRLVVFANPV